MVVSMDQPFPCESNFPGSQGWSRRPDVHVICAARAQEILVGSPIIIIIRIRVEEQFIRDHRV